MDPSLPEEGGSDEGSLLGIEIVFSVFFEPTIDVLTYCGVDCGVLRIVSPSKTRQEYEFVLVVSQMTITLSRNYRQLLLFGTGVSAKMLSTVNPDRFQSLIPKLHCLKDILFKGEFQ